MLFAACAWLGFSMPAVAAPPPADTPYPGTLQLQVDATDLDHRIFRVHETVPVAPGPLTLYYPQWIPGEHAAHGHAAELAGLKISAGGQPVAWRRDPLDPYAFNLEVPPGAAALDLDFENLSPIDRESGRVVYTPEMLSVQWHAVLLYPAGHYDRGITVQPSLRLPDGWQFGTALETAETRGAVTSFKPVSVETLIDSPVFAGRYHARIDLDPDAPAQGRGPVVLDVFGDNPAEIATTPEQVAIHRALVTQADRLFGARHFARYDFLLSSSDHLGWIGLEHQQSSENGVTPGYFSDWAHSITGRDLLAHEYVHSWNGKFRRPADLWTPNTNTPMQDSLLWMYEGQTQFWGYVLAARSGLVPAAPMRDVLAQVAASSLAQRGRAWRNLQDTTQTDLMGDRHDGRYWPDWQRGVDYYDEMALVWLEADMLIRDESHGQRSLEDFARGFFGIEPGRTAPLTYTFEDVVAALERVQHHDWAGFLRTRLDTHETGPQVQGLERAGWRLGWSETPNSAGKGYAEKRHYDDFEYSLGLRVGHEGALELVRWGSPAFEAGLSTSVQLLAVNGIAYKAERLAAAITAAKGTATPIELLVRDGDHYRSVSVRYAGGLRYPTLVRIEGVEDRLGVLLAPK